MPQLAPAYYHGIEGTYDRVSAVIRAARWYGIEGSPDVVSQWHAGLASVSVYCSAERWHLILQRAGSVRLEG